MRARWGRTVVLAASSVLLLGGCAVSDSARASDPARSATASTPTSTTSTPARREPRRPDWDPGLGDAMAATGTAVHEEAVLEQLLADLESAGRRWPSQPLT